MAVEAPLSVDETPVPAPQRGDRATFSARYDAHITWQTVAVPQFNALAVNVNHNAADAATSATTAAAQAATATAQAAAALASAAAAASSASSADNFRNYAADSAAAALASQTAAGSYAATAASQAAAVLAAGALAGLPVLTGQAGKILRVKSAEDGLELTYAEVGILPYASRNTLRTNEGLLRQVMVTGLGLFAWVSGSTEPDDDATCFRSATGAWEMKLIDPEYSSGLWAPEIDRLSLGTDRMLRATFSMTLTSISGNTSTAFVVPVAGAIPGDTVIATPGNAFGTTSVDQSCLSYSAYINEAGSVTVTIRNADGTTRNMVASTWSVLVIKQ